MLEAVFAELVAIPKAELESFGFDSSVDLQAAAASPGGTLPLYRLLARQTTEPARTKTIEALNQYWRTKETFKVLAGWRDELWPVYGRGSGDKANQELLFSVERAATGLFGVVRYGVHLTAYVADSATSEIKIWVPRRAATKSTYPSMLDNTVAGGLMTAEDPFECMVREADEEASLPEHVVRDNVKAAGIITYVYITDERAGGEAGYIYPECEWIYDLLLPESVVPQPKDGEVESFMLCTVAEVREQLSQGLYKPNCAVVLVHFLARHGLLTLENEPHLAAIMGRLQRKLAFPGPHEAEQ